jgi:outer membrane protein assembly factor BamB
MRLAFVVMMGLVAGALAEDWCQWRGPAFNGTSPETGLPNALGEEQQQWVIELPGPGEATPAICDGVIYLSGYDETNKTLFVMQVAEESGAVLWSETVASFEKMPRRNVIASPSPVADKEGAVFMFSNGIVVRFSKAGKEVWRRDLVAEYGPLSVGWSYSSSPLLVDGILYIAVVRKDTPPKGSTYNGSMESYLLGLGVGSGEVVFKVDRPTDAQKDFQDSYSTPVPVKVGGKTQILVRGGNYITAHDPATGEELWRSNYMDVEQNWGRMASTPVVEGNMIYSGFPSGTRFFAQDLEEMAQGKGEKSWVYDELNCDVSSPVLWDGFLYVLQEKKQKLVCIDPENGSEQWVGALERGDTFYASPTAADGKLYIVNRKGFVTVVAADPSAFKVLSTRAFDEKPTDSTIAVANGNIFLRTAKHLYCFGN